jgi:hydrogenase maturation protein HypF
MGRLFDAVSSLAGVCAVAKYEGQAAVELEKVIAMSYELSAISYNFDVAEEEGVLIIDPAKLIRKIVCDLKKKTPAGIISLKFHNAVCHMVKDVCGLLRKKYRINRVCMSGGVFQNKYLANNVRPMLEDEGFEVYLHKCLPAHDGNIALGQAVLAGA